MQPSNGFNASRLFVNGQPARPGPKRGQYLLRRSDGTDIIAYFKGGFPDPVPVLMVDNQPFRLAEPLLWYQWAWAGLPLILLFLGGAIGGGLGAGAMMLNAQILRSNRSVLLKYALSGAVSLVAFGVWFVIVSLITAGRGK